MFATRSRSSLHMQGIQFILFQAITVSRGGSRIYKRVGLTQSTNLLARGVQSMLELHAPPPPQEIFEK